MLELRVNNESIDLPDEISIRFIRKSPIFHPNEGSFSYPFTLPLTDRNKRIFNFPHRINRRIISSKDFSCKLYHSGIRWATGTLTINETEGRTAQAYMKIDRGNFNSVVADTLLSEIDFGIRELPQIGTQAFYDYVYATQINYGSYDHVYAPVRNQKILDIMAQLWPGWESIYLTGQNDFYWDGGSPRTLLYTMTPFFKVKYILEFVFKSFGIQLTENFFSQSELSQLVIYTNTLLRYLYDYGTYFPGMIPQEHLPEIKIVDFVQSLCSMFNCQLFLNENMTRAKLINIDSIVTSNPIADLTKYADPRVKILSNSPIVGFQHKMGADGSDDYWSNNMKDSLRYSENFYGEVADLTALNAISGGLSLRFKIAYVQSLDEFWQNSLVGNTFEWTFLSDGLQETYQEDGWTDTISTDAGTILMKEWDQRRNVPTVEQDLNWGSINVMSENRYKASLRLLFYRGVRGHDINGVEYPLLSNDIYDIYKVPIGGYQFALRWDTERGLIYNWHRKTLEWKKSRYRSVERTMNLPAQVIKQIEFESIYRIDESNYLIDSLDFQMTRTSILPAKVILAKI